MKILVVDGNSYINRAYYGVGGGLTNSDGQATGAIYGFCTMLNKLLKDHKPDGLCVTFDRKEPTFRHINYPEYKGTRDKMPADLVSQLPLLKKVLDAMNVCRIEMAGWEADDLMGTIARCGEYVGWETVIATGDKDALQLVTSKTVVAYTGQKGNTLYDVATFEEKYGFAPIHLVDLKAFMGDASDNIPGIKGIGEKTILPILQIHNTIDEVYNCLDADDTLGLKPAALKKMREGRESAEMSYDLALIRTDAPIEENDFKLEQTILKKPNEKKLYELLRQLELNKLIALYELQAERSTEKQAVGNYEQEEITTLEAGRALIEEWAGKEVAVLPLPDLAGVALCLKVKKTSQVRVVIGNNFEDYPLFLKEIFTAPWSIIAFESKQLHYELLQEGISATNITFDVELAAYLLSPESKEYVLEELGKSYFRYDPVSSELYLGEESFCPLSDPTEAIKAWAAHSMLLAGLKELFLHKMEQQELVKLFEEIEMPLCKILAKMECKGIGLDKKALTQYGEKIGERLKTLEASIHKEAGEKFNIGSPKQLGGILFDKMELSPVKKTKTGFSTNVEVLEELKKKYPDKPIIDQVLEQRHLSKLQSTYVNGLLESLTPQGRIHTTFKNTVTTTGRLSSTEPNLQNIPIRTKLGEELRYMFVAEEGKVLIDVDYSQIELRLLAHLSGDEAMIAAFSSGEDFHRETASQVFHVPVEEVTGEMRRSAKAVNFGIVYGMSAFSLSQDIDVTVAEAQAYMKRYFETYPNISLFMKKILEEGRREGWVATAYGRKRWIPDLKAGNAIRRNAAERIAQNMPMQGTAADVVKLAMLAVDRLLEDHPEAEMVLQIHDEILVECPQEQGEELTRKVEETMRNVAEFSVPLLVDGNFGKNWGEAH